MAHEIEIDENGDGRIFVVGEPAWHGLGRVLDSPPTIVEGIVKAGLNWEVGVKRLYREVEAGKFVASGGCATVRLSDNKELGIVGPEYTPLQNIEAFEWFQSFLDSGAVTLESAGSLRDGARVWVLAKVVNGTADVTRGDAITSYILLSNGHDGLLAARGGFTRVRVLCANTVASAHNAANSKLMRVRHSRKIKDGLALIRDIMNVEKESFEATMEQYRALTRKGVKAADVSKYVCEVFNLDAEAKGKEKPRLLNKLLEAYEAAPGQNVAGAQGTMWGAYNAVTFMLSHMRGRTLDNRYSSLWFGQSANDNARALEVALRMAA